MIYCEIADLLKIKKGIEAYNVVDFDDHIALAAEQFEENLDVRWYRSALYEKFIAGETSASSTLETEDLYGTYPFDPEKLTVSGPVKRCVCYLAIAKICENRAENIAITGSDKSDKFQENAKMYFKKYDEAFDNLLLYGVSYDFDADGEISPKEYNYRAGKVRGLVLERG